ncbi:MAG TPA: RodZ domain-containing protein [Acidimicrobiales bacterium]|nr:RodZ domain-containing protein [Acidimicrobiales bacterium]
MTALVVIGLIAVVAIAVVWSRVGGVRSERRSMREYHRALDVLGDVARRSEAAARIRPVRPEQVERGHVRTEPPPPGPQPVEERPARAEPPAARPEPVAVPRPRLEQAPVAFEDDSDAFERAKEEEVRETVVAAGPLTPTVSAGSPPDAGPTPPAGSPARGPVEGEQPVPLTRSLSRRGGRRRPPSVRRAVPGAAAAAVVVAGLVLVGLRLSAAGTSPRSSAPDHGARGSGRHGSHHRQGSGPPAATGSTVPSTTVPSQLVPVSTSPTDVAFVAPQGTYDILLSDTGGTCWVGIQQSTNGPWIWQETLYSGQSATYRATGPLVIRIGAPKYLGVKVNGLPARLPGFVQPYDLTFSPSSQPSSA